MNDFLEYYSRHLEAVTKANVLNKPIVFDALAAAGLTLVEVEFDGEGDSGQIEEIYAYAGDTRAEFPDSSLTLHQGAHNKSDPTTTIVSLRDAIEILCYDYLSQPMAAGRTMTAPTAYSGSTYRAAVFISISTSGTATPPTTATTSEGGDHGTSLSPRAVQRPQMGRRGRRLPGDS